MIVPMKKVTLFALGDGESATLNALRALGVMQIEIAKENRSEDTATVAESCDTARRVLKELVKARATIPEEIECVDANKHSGAETIERAAGLFETRNKLQSELDSVRQRRKNLAVWGEFKRETVDELKAKGVHVYLCFGREDALAAAKSLKDAVTEVMHEEKGRYHFAVFSATEIESGALPEIRLTVEDNPAELRRRETMLGDEIVGVYHEIAELFCSIPAAEHRVRRLAAELEYMQVADSLGKHDTIISLRGFVPVPAVDRLEKAAEENGWGLLVEDPGPDDRVPTLLASPKWVKTVEPLFQFLGINPGYEEIDVSAGVLIFFTIFYAMIIGDAGYGLIFLTASCWAAWHFRGKPAAKLPVRLFLLLSSATVVWGAMSGNYFGCSAPAFLEWAKLPALTGDEAQANTQYFCFILALSQLTLGRIWRAIHEGTIKSALGNLGWILMLIGNFMLIEKLIVYPGDFQTIMYYFFGAGLLLTFTADLDFKSVAAWFQFPFSVINSFVDMLSYIRLFAVGLAGFYIASSFNNMGHTVFALGVPDIAVLDWILKSLLAIAAAGIILFGHGLNIGLCLMSVMVHGVRLNTLEFSSHVGLNWAGLKFKPFANKKTMEEN